MSRLYRYVGPAKIMSRATRQPGGTRIDSVADLLSWAQSNGQRPVRDGYLVGTFVIDEQGELLLADRHSEHIACAGGRPVLSAGEVFFSINGDRIEVTEISNQSTGFCPEPKSWPAVATALDRAHIAHPGMFTTQIVFRLCQRCGERNVVKDSWFVCGVCGGELPREWNF